MKEESLYLPLDPTMNDTPIPTGEELWKCL